MRFTGNIRNVARHFVFFVMAMWCGVTVRAQINTTQVMQMGRAALYYDDYVTAIHYFNSVLDAKPYLSDAYYYRGHAKFQLEDYEGAERDLIQAIAFNPFRVEYYQLRGLCRIHNTRYEEAISDYSHVIGELPEDQSAHYNRALCRLEIKDYETASTDLDVILKRWPKFTRAYLVKAQTCLALGDTLSGLTWIDSLLTLSKRESAAWSFKGRYALAHDEYSLADSCYTEALKYDAGNAEYHLERAQARGAMSRYAQALADYDRVIEMIPQHYVAHYNRGLIRKLVGDDNRAIEDFDFIIATEPDNVLAIYNRAELRQLVGDYSGAAADYSVLLRLYPNFLYGYARRAECYRAIGQISKALRDETRVTEAELDMLFNRNRRSEVKKVRTRSDRELEHYEQLVREDEDTARVTFLSEFGGKVQNRRVERVFLPTFEVDNRLLSVVGGRAPIFCGDDALLAFLTHNRSLPADERLATLREYAKGDGRDEAVVHYNLGCLEAEAGTLDEADHAFTRASELDPLMAEAYYNRAVVHLLLDDTDTAAPLLSRAGEMGLFRAYNLLKQARKANSQKP